MHTCTNKTKRGFGVPLSLASEKTRHSQHQHQTRPMWDLLMDQVPSAMAATTPAKRQQQQQRTASTITDDDTNQIPQNLTFATHKKQSSGKL